MENFTKLLAVTLYIFSLSGCTSIGSYVMSNPGIYLSEAQFIKAKPSDIGFEKHTFCSFSTTQCITYLTAESYQAETACITETSSFCSKSKDARKSKRCASLWHEAGTGRAGGLKPKCLQLKSHYSFGT